MRVISKAQCAGSLRRLRYSENIPYFLFTPNTLAAALLTATAAFLTTGRTVVVLGLYVDGLMFLIIILILSLGSYNTTHFH